MINVIHGGDEEFNAFIYGQKHPSTLNFLQNSMQAAQNLASTLTEVGKGFFATIGNMFDKFNGSEAMRRMRNALEKVDNINSMDVIKYLPTIASVQQAQPMMQRFIMANPVVRQMYLDNRLDGFSDQYVNVHGNAIGNSHYDYRLVMNGYMQVPEEPKDENDQGVIMDFYDERPSSELDLDLAQQNAIVDTWANVIAWIQQGREDPTSPWGAKL